MFTKKDIKAMDFGLKEGDVYIIYSKNKKNKTKLIMEGSYIGESGVDKDYFIFISTKNGARECFLKIDLIINEYKIVKANESSREVRNIKYG